MAATGAVNIRLGLIVTDLINGATAGRAAINQLTSDVNGKLSASFASADRQQRVYDRGLGRLGGQMQDFGKKAAVVSGILLGIGAAAFSSYSDIDGMQRGLKAVVGNATEAGIQFQEFRGLARLPGLGLSEVTRAGLQLETLGFQAKEAQKDIYQVGNAIALAGDGKEAFGAVITQFTQMAGKSKVLGDDLKPILNASPVIAKAISSIFGTVDSEEISGKLQSAGKGPRDFINLLVAELAKLERVQGGPKNAVENFTDSLTIAGYEASKAADEVLDLTGKIDSAGTRISGAATAFGQLPAPAKAASIGLVSAAVAVGPLALGLGTVIKLIPTVTAGLGAMRIAFLAATGPIGLTVAAAAGLGIAAYSIYQFNSALKSTVDTNQLLAGVSRDTTAAIATERARLESLVKIARDETESKQARANAIKQINALSPKYLGDLTTESINTAKASTAIREYLGLIGLKAKARVTEQKLGEAEVKLEEAQARRRARPQVSTADALAATLQNPLEIFFGQGKDGKGRQDALTRTKARNVLAEQDAQKEVEFYKGLFEKTNTELTRLGENTQVDVPAINFSGPGKSGIQEAKDRLKTLATEIASDNLKGIDTSAKQDEYNQLKSEINDATASLKNQKAASDSVGNSISVNERLLKRYELQVKNAGDAATEQQLNQVRILREQVEREKLLAKPEKIEYEVSVIGDSRQQLLRIGDQLRAFDISGGVLLPGLVNFRQSLSRQVQDTILAVQNQKQSIAFAVADIPNIFGSVKDEVGRVMGQDPFNAKGIISTLASSTQAISDAVQTAKSNLTSGFVDLFGGLGESAGAGRFSFKRVIVDIVSLIASGVTTIGKALILTGIPLLSNPITAALGTKQILTGGGLVLAAGAAKGLAQAAFPFANGGIVYGPTLGLMGEYSGARNNPEVIAPLNKLKSILGNQGPQVMIPDIVLDGQMIRIVLMRANESYAQFS